MSSDGALLGEFEPNPKAALPVLVLIGVFLGGVAGLVLGGMIAFGGGFAVMAAGLPPETMYVAVGTGVLLPIVGFAGVVLWGYKNVDSVTYKVYADHVAEEGGWLSSNHKTVPFDDVTKVKYSQGIVGKKLDVGTVKISTIGEDGTSLKLAGVEHARALYRDIEALASDDVDVDRYGFEALNTSRVDRW